MNIGLDWAIVIAALLIGLSIEQAGRHMGSPDACEYKEAASRALEGEG